VEHEADVRPGGGELSPIVPIAVHFGAFASGKASAGMTLAKSSAKVESLLRVRRHGAGKFNTPMMLRQINSDRLLGKTFDRQDRRRIDHLWLETARAIIDLSAGTKATLKTKAGVMLALFDAGVADLGIEAARNLAADLDNLRPH